MRLPRLLLLAAVVVVAACGPDGPAIQEVSPAKGDQNVAGDAPVRVSFNHEMDHQSVESRFAIKPVVEGCDAVGCPVTWSGRTLAFSHPHHPFTPDTIYRVTLKAGYRDSAGRAEGNDHLWEFRSEAAPSVGAVTPADGTVGTAVDSDISVQLSRTILVPSSQQLTLVGAGDPEPVQARVSLDPADGRRLVISPLVLLRPRTAYTLHLSAELSDTHHNPIGAARDYHFTTGRLDLSRSLAFLVRDTGGAASSRVALLRPPAGLGSPPPSLRVVYRSSQPIQDFGWSSDSTRLYVRGGDGKVEIVPLDGSASSDSGIVADALAPSPANPELAYVAGGTLHLWRPAADPPADVAVAQAGQVRGAVAWSGDGRRLAVTSDDGGGGLVLRIVDRETLSVSEVPGGAVAPGPLAWSADGAAVAFTRPGSEVWAYRPLATPGGGGVRLGMMRASGLSWSSDGAILFASGPLAGPGPVQRAPGAPIDGQATGFVPLPGSRPGDGQAVAPAFDRRVAFVRPTRGVPEAWIMNNDGTGVTQLTFASYYPDDRLVADGVDLPRWSPGNAP